MKKHFIFSFLAMIMLLSSVQAVAFAENDGVSAEKKEIPLEIERVDVPYAEAVKDSTFSPEKSLRSKTGSSRASDDGWWDVYGNVQMVGTEHCQAVGRSALYTDNTNNKILIEIYHYTRTFFGTTLNPLGDSGRVWGDNVVYAFGKSVPWGHAVYKSQKVFYGIEV